MSDLEFLQQPYQPPRAKQKPPRGKFPWLAIVCVFLAPIALAAGLFIYVVFVTARAVEHNLPNSVYYSSPHYIPSHR